MSDSKLIMFAVLISFSIAIQNSFQHELMPQNWVPWVQPRPNPFPETPIMEFVPQGNYPNPPFPSDPRTFNLQPSPNFIQLLNMWNNKNPYPMWNNNNPYPQWNRLPFNRLPFIPQNHIRGPPSLPQVEIATEPEDLDYNVTPLTPPVLPNEVPVFPPQPPIFPPPPPVSPTEIPSGFQTEAPELPGRIPIFPPPPPFPPIFENIRLAGLIKKTGENMREAMKTGTFGLPKMDPLHFANGQFDIK